MLMKKRLTQFETEATTELLWYAETLYSYFPFCHTDIKMSTQESRRNKITTFSASTTFVNATVLNC